MASNMPQNKFSRARRWVLIGAMLFFAVQLVAPAIAVPRPAQALFGIGDVSITVGDIPRTIYEILSKTLKTAADVAFKNVLRNYLNSLAYNVATQIATGEKGQKPLFVTNPKQLLTDAGDAAAGDLLDSIASDWIGKSACQGYPGTSCKADGSCDPVNLACPANANISDCLSSIENKNACIAQGCIVVQCTQTDIESSNCPPENPPEGYEYYTSGAPECISNFSLCDLGDPTLKIQLNVLARNTYFGVGGGAVSGRCPLTDIIDKYDEYREAIENGTTGNAQPGKQYLVEFSKTFNPEATQLGAFVDILNNTTSAKLAETEINKFAQSLAGEFKPVTNLISGTVKTPASLLGNAATSIFGKSIDPYLTYTGTAIADAVGIFTNTLAQKLIQRYIFGLDPSTSTGGGKSKGLASFLGGSSPGVTAAKFLFSDLQQTSYSVAGTTDILSTLSSCPSPSNPTPGTCVIDSRFRTAIEQQMTVQQALDQGLLDGSKPFGYTASGLEPEYYNGYPYRSLVILRSYRIIPVGWELAAQYMKDFSAGNYSLNSLIADYDNIDSPFYRLVDPNWVLKAPELFCRREGAGEQVISRTPIRNEDTNGDGIINTKDAASYVVQRQGDYCADEQQCLKQNDDGSCAQYGYCIEDKDIWKFAGTACDPQFATCQSLTRSDGTQVSYVLSTVDTNGCNASNAGCKWYCENSSWNAATGQYACNGAPPGATGSGNKISFNESVRQCGSSSAGCTALIARKNSGANIYWNTGFEQYVQTPDGLFDGTKDTAAPDDFNYWSMYANAANCGVQPLAVSEAHSGFTANRLSSYPACAGSSLPGHPLDGGNAIMSLAQPNFDYSTPVTSRTFTFSLYAKKAADDADCTAGNGQLSFHSLRYDGTWVPTKFADVTTTGNWTRYSGTFTIPRPTFGGGSTQYLIMIIRREPTDTCDVIIDDVQLEEGNLTAYKPYEENPQTHLKLAPSYLNCRGLATDPAECAQYAQYCAYYEEGCEAYTSATTGRTITGIVSNPNVCNPNVPGSCDQCPAEYQGCSAFRELAIERPPYRPSRDPVSFVGSSGQSCPASAVGCEEYTNLEAVAAGGEGKEYYSFVRMCVPDTDPQKQAYYTWEGSNEFGFQLRQYDLKRSNQNSGPCTNIGAENDPVIQAQLGSNWPTCLDGGSVDRDGDGADDEFYTPATCDPADVGVNPDCTEFYDVSGNTYYLLRSRVIYADSNCKSYRNTVDGADMVYHMVPGAGISCQAQYAGCRAYKGNAGDNVRQIYVENFETGSIGAWTGSGSISTEATSAGGHSMAVANSVQITDAGSRLGFRSGNQYSISFWAKSAVSSSTTVAVSLNTAPAITFTGSAVAAAGQWNRYTLGPVFIPTGVDPSSAALLLYSNNAFYVDNIEISEVAENIYRVKDSYTECSGYEGCDLYTDRDGNQNYLKSFSRLCSEDKVGCEAMFHTHNSTSPEVSYFNRERYLLGDVDNDGRLTSRDVSLLNARISGTGTYETFTAYTVGDMNRDTAVNATDVSLLQNYVNTGTAPAEPYIFYQGDGIPRDGLVFVVNDPAKSCSAADKGCSRFGAPTVNADGNVTAYSDIYLINDPDRYADNLCVFSENMCEAYTAGNGSQYYFKDPGQKLCQFKRVTGQDVSGWYKQGTDQGAPDCPVSIGICTGGGDNDGALCNESSDCDSDFCNANPNVVSQPADGWVGSCPAGASGCTEYRDPEQVQSGSEIVSRNYAQNNGFEIFTDGPGPDTDGLINTPLPDLFDRWSNSWTTAGVCTGNTNITCNTDRNCSVAGAGTCNTTSRAACGLRLLATDDSHTGAAAAVGGVFDACGKSVDSTYPYYSCIDGTGATVNGLGEVIPNSGGRQGCMNDSECPATAYCQGDPQYYSWYTVDTDTITDNRAFSVSFYAKLDPNDPTCVPSGSNDDVFFSLVRTIDNRPWPDQQVEYRPGFTFNATSDWQRFEGVTTFGSTDPDDWYNTTGPVQELQNRFQLVFRQGGTGSADQCNIIFDSFTIAETLDTLNYVPYYYIKDTVDTKSCNGLVDRNEGCRLFNDTSQSSLTYASTLSADGEAPVGCSTPSECDSNTVVKVTKDRECKRWLACETSVQQEDAEGKIEELCLSRYVCEELDPNTGQCTKVSEYESVNQTYNTPTFANVIKNYTGLALVGLNWDRRCQNDPNISCRSNADCDGGLCSDAQIYEGHLPVAAMQELGAISIQGELVKNGDMGDSDYALNQKLSCPLSAESGSPETCSPETAPYEGDREIPLGYLNPNWMARNWDGGITNITWAEEDASNDGAIPSANANLDENNVARVRTGGDVGGGAANWNGVSYNLGLGAQRSESYYASFKLRWSTPPSEYDTVRVQFAYLNTGGTEVEWLTLGEMAPTETWKEYVVGPAVVGETNSGAGVDFASIRLQFVHHYNGPSTVPAAEFYLDDVSLKPVLETKEQEQELLARDCRLYPNSDSPYCTYTDENNTTFKGWEGYCIQRDPRYQKYCLQWWPVDLLKGESNVFSSLKVTGYSGRRPLYMCLQSDGNYNVPRTIWGVDQNEIFTRQAVNDTVENRDNGGDDCGVGDFPISPLFGQPYMYRSPMSTAIINHSGNGTCNEAGNMSSHVPPSNCTGTKSGICGSRDEDGNIFNSVYNADVQDRYYKWEIDHINFTLQRWSHPDWRDCAASSTDGIVIYTLNNNSTCSGGGNCWSGAYSCGGNIINISVNFDATDRLTSYTVRMYDSNDGGGAWVQGIFHLNEICTQIASVVSFDEDHVWFERTDSSSPYLLPDLLYTYHQHTTPFGGIIQPTPAYSTPESWRWDNGLGTGPLLVQNQADDTLAHGGSPYSCANGYCQGRMCNWGLNNSCANRAQQQSCLLGPDGTGNTTDDGYCIGLGQGFCTRNAEIYCSADADCLVGTNDFGPCQLGGGGAAGLTTTSQAVDHLMRLFARPVNNGGTDAWLWDSATGRYVTAPASSEPSLSVEAWKTSYRTMPACPYNAVKGSADRALASFPADYCGVPATVSNVLCGAGGNPSQGGCSNVSAGQVIQLTFNVNADPNQKPVKLIEVDFDGDGVPDYSTVGSYDSGNVYVTHEYTTGGNYSPRIRIVDNWGWCGVIKDAGSSCPTGDCRDTSIDGSACAWIGTGLSINVSP